MTRASTSPPGSTHLGDDAGADHPTRRAAFKSFMDAVHRTWPLRWSDVTLLVASYVALTSIGVGVGLSLTHVLEHSAVERNDQRISEWFAARRSPTWNTLSFIGSQLADTVVKIVVTTLICAVMIKVWKRWLEPIVVAVSLIVEAAAFITITTIVGRPRPDVPKLDRSPVGTSFPSGHVAAAVVYSAVLVVVFWHVRRRSLRLLLVVAAGTLAALVALARIYRGMHYLSDVVAGALLGVGSVVAVVVIMRAAAAREHQDIHCC